MYGTESCSYIQQFALGASRRSSELYRSVKPQPILYEALKPSESDGLSFRGRRSRLSIYAHIMTCCLWLHGRVASRRRKISWSSWRHRQLRVRVTSQPFWTSTPYCPVREGASVWSRECSSCSRLACGRMRVQRISGSERTAQGRAAALFTERDIEQ